ncbi:UNVERIFIED_CONTAM: hypothetical protein RMT77_007490 [Armadillidium vulgare]
MFRFNFQKKLNENNENEDSKPSHPQEEVVLKPISTHVVDSDTFKLFPQDYFEEKNWDGHIKLKYLHICESSPTLKEESILEEKSDLVPDVYEGGYKIWECTWDLLQHIKEEKYDFKNCRVLDLGCGSGILGIATTLQGASEVTFQDYNEDVINRWTIPNVVLNAENIDPLMAGDSAKDMLNRKFKFYSGDWGSFSKDLMLEEVNFDYILTSETIYNKKNYGKLINVFEKFLKPSGLIILASKSYYFGVGGGTLEFINTVKRSGFLVSSSVCHTKGVQREILIIKKKE